MKNCQLLAKLAALGAASFFTVSGFLVTSVHAEGWSPRVHISLNGFLPAIIDAYSIDDESGGTSSSSSFSERILSDKTDRGNSRKIDGLLSFGASVAKTFSKNEFVGLMPGLRFEGNLASARIVFPDGIGIFIDPIRIKSFALVASSSVFLRSRPVFHNLQFEVGATASVIKSWETFELGSWTIKESRSSFFPSAYLRAEYQLLSAGHQKDGQLLPIVFGEVSRSSIGTTGTIGLQVAF